MYYVLGFRRETQGLGAFHATTDSERALRIRFTWEHENLQDGVHHEENVVVIGAPDLYTLTQRYQRYFAGCRNGIGHCYFCRSFLGWDHLFPEREAVELLSRAAEAHGHCLLCHDAYPVWCLGGHYHLDQGFQDHMNECPVMIA